MKENLNKIGNLLDSGLYENIELAFQLTLGMGINNIPNNVISKLKMHHEMCIQFLPTLLDGEKDIYVYNKPVGTIPDSIHQLSNLKSLRLIGSSLTSLPDSIGKLKNLVLLDLSNNLLTSLPDSIGDLVSLRWLNLHNNHINKLPDTIVNLCNIRVINIVNNNIDNYDIIYDIPSLGRGRTRILKK